MTTDVNKARLIEAKAQLRPEVRNQEQGQNCWEKIMYKKTSTKNHCIVCVVWGVKLCSNSICIVCL